MPETHKIQTKTSIWFPNLALFLISLITAVALSEFAVRVLFPAPAPASVTIHQLSQNPVLIYEPSPGAQSVSADGILHQVNADGFRDRDYSVEKPADTARMVFLGDSVVYGYGVRREDALPKKLEAEFLKHGVKAEVLNLGVSGYDTAQEVEFLKTKGLKYGPETVILGFTLNDMRYASWELETFWSGFTANITGKAGNPFQEVLAWLFSHSRLLKLLDRQFHLQKRATFLQGTPLLNEYVEKKAEANRDEPDSEYAGLEKQIEEKARELGTSAGSLDFDMREIGFRNEQIIYKSQWKACARAFQKLKKLAEENHFQVTVVIFPLISEMQKYPLGPLHEFLKKNFDELGFKTVDLTEPCRKLAVEFGQTAISADSVHLTPLASAKLAEYLREQIAPSPAS